MIPLEKKIQLKLIVDFLSSHYSLNSQTKKPLYEILRRGAFYHTSILSKKSIV